MKSYLTLLVHIIAIIFLIALVKPALGVTDRPCSLAFTQSQAPHQTCGDLDSFIFTLTPAESAPILDYSRYHRNRFAECNTQPSQLISRTIIVVEQVQPEDGEVDYSPIISQTRTSPRDEVLISPKRPQMTICIYKQQLYDFSNRFE